MEYEEEDMDGSVASVHDTVLSSEPTLDEISPLTAAETFLKNHHADLADDTSRSTNGLSLYGPEATAIYVGE